MARPQVSVVAVVVCVLAGGRSDAQVRPPGGLVTLPVDDYRALRARAADVPAAPPARAALTRLDYALDAGGDLVSGRATLTIDVTGDGWVTVPLPSGLAIREARLDGQPLVLDAGPPPTVHLSRPGRAVLALDVAFVPADANGAITLALPASTAAVTAVALDIAGTAHRVTADGGVVDARVEHDQRTRWSVHGRPGAALTLHWTRRRDDPRATAPLQLAATVDTTAGLRDALVQLAVGVSLEIRQGLAREVALLVPAGVTVTDVRGAAVDDWRVDGRRLRVSFVEPIATATRLDVRAEAVASGDAIGVPLLQVPDAERETGAVVIDVGQEAEVVDAHAVGLDAVDPRTAGARAPTVAAARTFRLHPAPGTTPRRLDLTIARYAAEAVPVATIDEARFRAFAAASGRVLVEARYLVRNNQRSAVALRLPDGAGLWQAQVGERSVRPGRAADGRLVVPLDMARAGDAPAESVVAVVYLWQGPPWTDGDARLPLPAVDLPVAQSALLLHHPPRTRIAVGDGAFHLTEDVAGFTDPLGPVSSLAAVDDARSGAPADVIALLAEARGGGRGETSTHTREAALDFPAAGPSVFLRAELTPESVAPVVVLSLRHR